MLHDCCFVDGIRIDHTNSEVDAIFEFIVAKEICGFVELDMGEGGLALCLMKEIPKLHYIGITKSLGLICDATKLQNEKHTYTHILLGEASNINMVDTIGILVEHTWPVLYYCTGEYKKSQLNLYRNLVRFGDYIGIHNYWNKSRVIPEMPEYPCGELKPEVLDTDLRFLKHEFQSVQFESLINTRIAILQRRTK